MCELSGSKDEKEYRALLRLKVELQSYGLKMVDPPWLRQGGAGPAEGQAFMLGPLSAMIPLRSRFVELSPYAAQLDGNGYHLLKQGIELTKIQVVPTPKFFGLNDEDGTPFFRLALLHGRSCLGSTVDQRCIYWGTPSRCRFCGIELSCNSGATTAWKHPSSLARVARAARDLDGVEHATLTTGTAAAPDAGAAHLAACTRAVKEAAGLAVHVQISPPRDPGALELLRDSGADTIGIHIESCDMQVLKRVAPAKAALGLDTYRKVWKEAVKLFGPGQVSSFLIAGLGEKPASLVAGARTLSEMGVFPYIVPLRPIPGSLVADLAPPTAEAMWDIYEQAAGIIKENGLYAADSRAGCVRCSACSAIGDFRV